MVVRFTFLFLISFCAISSSQIAVTNNAPMDNEEYLVNNILLGDDLETSNFSSVGFANGIGYFDSFAANIGFDEGVILSSGGLAFVTDGFGTGSGISGDSDLELALNAINLTWGVNNVTILEFDFVAESESVTFNYVFGSMEYTSYTCSVFNDIFGFFLSGPGITGPYSNEAINLAYIPDPDNPGEYTTTPVAVNTVNSGTPSGFNASGECDDIDPDWASYNVYWIDNDYTGNDWQGVNEPPDPEFTVEGITGFTTPLTAEYNGLICGETYHIKLAIADASDGALNSVVFLEANSFVSPSVVVNPLSNIDGPDLFDDPLAIYEGCAAAQLEFNASGNTEYEIILEVQTSGTCEYGVDFEISYEDGTPIGECVVFDSDIGAEVIVPCITIAPNQNTLYINIEAFYDDLNEGMEDLLFIINAIDGVCQQAELAVSEISFNLYDQIPIVVDPGPAEIIQCFGDEVTLEPASISGGYIGESDDYTYEWYNEDGVQIGSEQSISVTATADSEYTLTVYDDCQDQMVTIVCSVEVEEYSDIEIAPVSDPEFPCYGEIVELTANASGGSGDYSYMWEDNSNAANSSYDYTFESGSAQQFVDLEIFDNCSAQSYNFQIPVDLIGQSPIDNITIPDPACYGDMVEIISNPSGGSGDYSYVWPGSSDPCDCESYEHEFDIDDGEEQVVTFDIIDNCTNETFSQDVTIVLQVTEQPVTEISIIGEQFCPGDEISLSAQSEGESTYTYEWIDLDDGEWYDNEQANISPDDSDLDDGDPETSTYYVTVIDDCNGFSWIEQIDITVPVYEEPTFDLPDLEGCVGDVLEIIPQDQLAQGVQSEDDFTYLWSNGETTPTIEIVVEEDPTEYSLVLMDLCGFEGDENIEGDMAIANITVSVPPAPEFTFDQDVEDVQFIQLTEGIFSNYEWDFDNDGTIDSYEFEPTHTYEEEGDFTVVLTAYDDLGCENKFNAIINVSASLFFYAPDIFTPNGDGINEAFHVSVVGHQQNGFELSVFDRWGKQVFYTTDPNEGWDGKYLNGTEVPQDVYLYKATMIKEGGEDETVRKGKVSIVK